MKKRLRKQVSESFSRDNNPNFYCEKVVRRMLIIIPQSCFSATKLHLDAKRGMIRQLNVSMHRTANRAGREGRDYTIPIYKMTIFEPEVCKLCVLAFSFLSLLLTLLLSLFLSFSFSPSLFPSFFHAHKQTHQNTVTISMQVIITNIVFEI